MADDTRWAYENGGPRPRLAVNNDGTEPRPAEKPPEPFSLQPLHILDQKSIKHRQWIYGTRLIRGFVTLLIAPGGTGKSSMILAMCMEIATKRSFLNERIHQQCNAALLNLEDPQDEVDRRVTALAMRYGICQADIAGRLFVSPPERSVTIAANGADGFSVVHPHEKQIIEKVKDEKIGVLAVDPFAESHTLEENSNPQMIQAAAAWRRVAREGDCSVLLAHHVRKGLVDSIEAARGAKALTDSARVGLLLSTMTEADADDLGISSEARLQYARLDDAKANMAPRAPKASWYHLSHVTLDNADEIYPRGDQVVVIEPWQPASVWEKVQTPDANTVLDIIAAGIPKGGLFTDNRRGGSERWAGNVLIQHLNVTSGQAASILRAWITNGVLIKETYFDAAQRKDRIGLTVCDAKRPGASYA